VTRTATPAVAVAPHGTPHPAPPSGARACWARLGISSPGGSLLEARGVTAEASGQPWGEPRLGCELPPSRDPTATPRLPAPALASGPGVASDTVETLPETLPALSPTPPPGALAARPLGLSRLAPAPHPCRPPAPAQTGGDRRLTLPPHLVAGTASRPLLQYAGPGQSQQSLPLPLLRLRARQGMEWPPARPLSSPHPGPGVVL
jgi:hypothetical protein